MAISFLYELNKPAIAGYSQKGAYGAVPVWVSQRPLDVEVTANLINQLLDFVIRQKV
jgi:hypothetical protein